MANKRIGGNFDDFLAEEAMLEEVTATTMKRVIAWQIQQEVKAPAHHQNGDGEQDEDQSRGA